MESASFNFFRPLAYIDGYNIGRNKRLENGLRIPACHYDSFTEALEWVKGVMDGMSGDIEMISDKLKKEMEKK